MKTVLSEVVYEVADREWAGEEMGRNDIRLDWIRLERINDCLSSLSPDQDSNINRLTALAGELLSGAFALYSRIEDGFLHYSGQWQTPPGFRAKDTPDGHICYDMICETGEDLVLISNLSHTPYKGSDPSVSAYGLQTCFGQAVKCEGKPVGSFCVMYQSDYRPTHEDQRILRVVASAIVSEERRKEAERDLRTSRRRLTVAMDMAQLVHWECDIESGMFSFDDHFYALYGTTAEHEGEPLMPARVYAERFCHPEDSWVVATEIEKAIVSTNPDYSGYLEHRIIRADGQERFLAVRHRIIKDGAGRTIKMYGANQDITEWKHAMMAIEEDEKYAKMLFHDSIVPQIVMDAKTGRCIDCNEAAVRTYGYGSREELLGKTPVDLGAPTQYDGTDSAKAAKERIRACWKDGSHVFEWRHQRPDGQIWDAEVHLMLFRHRGKALVQSTFQDITERKRAKKALAENEQLYRNLFENAAIGMFQTALDGSRFLRINKSFAAMLGYESPEEVISAITDTYTQIHVHPQNRYVLLAARGKDEWYYAEQLYLRKDGSIMTGKLAVRKVRNPDTSDAFLEGFVEDITEHKRAEEELRATHQRLFDIIEFLPEATFVIDDEKRVVAWNRACEEMTGVKKEEIIGKGDYAYAIPFYGERRPILIDYVMADFGDFEERYKQTKKSGNRLHAEAFVPGAYNGRGAYLSGHAAPLCDRTGKVVGAIECLFDQTEFKRLETRLRQSQKLEAIGTLTGGIAHDFNNILMAITGYGSLLQMEIAEGNHLRLYVDQILSGSQKAAQLTQALLAFSRQQPITLKPLDINDTISGTEKLLKRLLTEDIAVCTVLTPHNIIVMADAAQIDQILFNLVTNARDAMPHGGVLTIETKAVQLDEEFRRCHGFGEAGKYALLSISDTGTGMDETTKEKIFDPFYTTKEVGKGTGLGLATVYGIVKQHHGHIDVSSVPGEGTTFSIYLPVVEKAAEGEKTCPPAAIKRGNETILVAEDDTDVRLLLQKILTGNGYTILETSDGQDAIDKFKEHGSIDLMILDSVMPRKNGRDAYDVIRGMSPRVKAIFMSGYTRDIVLDKGVEEGKVDFIAKPISPHELLKKVREALDT